MASGLGGAALAADPPASSAAVQHFDASYLITGRRWGLQKGVSAEPGQAIRRLEPKAPATPDGCALSRADACVCKLYASANCMLDHRSRSVLSMHGWLAGIADWTDEQRDNGRLPHACAVLIAASEVIPIVPEVPTVSRWPISQFHPPNMLASTLRPQLSSGSFSKQGISLRRASRPQRVVGVYAKQSAPEEPSLREKLAVPAAALMGAALLFAATPDAAEAARSGGRVGGSSGFRSRAPPARCGDAAATRPCFQQPTP